jgi:two-component system, OmpR family, sensor kinase
MRTANPRRTRKHRRLQLRHKVLASVLSVTILALVAFDIAAVSALRGYLMNQTDSRLHTVLGAYRALDVTPGTVHFKTMPGAAAQARTAAHPGPRPSVAVPRKQTKIVGPRFALPPAVDRAAVGRTIGQYSVGWVSWKPAAPKGTTWFVQGPSSLRPKLPPNLRAIATAGYAVTVYSAHGRIQLRLRAMPILHGSLFATTSLGDVNKTVTRLELILIIGSAIAGLLVAVGVVAILRRGLRPIEHMAAQADLITAGDLTDRVSPQDPQTEVGRLATALNDMLARIEASVAEREASQELTRQFFADASHELRNPLASLRANAELYQQGALPYREQVDEAFHRISFEAQRMSVLVDDMLRLARLDQQPVQQHSEVDLSALVSDCAERARIADPRRNWLVWVEPDLAMTGDEDQLRRAVDNLLANVRSHTPADTVGVITAESDGASVVVEVSDNGPGVPAARLPRIFDRFYRGDPATRSPGCGLGLAIVSAIASAHGGIAEAASNEPRGLRVTLTLPASGVPCTAEQLTEQLTEPLTELAASDDAHDDEPVLVS